jgi:hypothetical protein
MNIFPFKRRLRRQAVANLLYEDLFCILADNIPGFLSEGLVGKSSVDTSKIKLECFSLIAFLITFSFQREFEYLGQDVNKFILDCFHVKLFENVSETSEDETFPNLLKTRYGEYYPIMKEDLRCLGIKDTILFGGVTESFFKKIAPEKLRSEESILFGCQLADLYSLICKTYDEIKKYKIG